MRREDMLFVGGECSPPSTGDVIEVISPHTEAVIADGYVDTKSVSVARRG